MVPAEKPPTSIATSPRYRLCPPPDRRAALRDRAATEARPSRALRRTCGPARLADEHAPVTDDGEPGADLEADEELAATGERVEAGRARVEFTTRCANRRRQRSTRRRGDRAATPPAPAPPTTGSRAGRRRGRRARSRLLRASLRVLFLGPLAADALAARRAVLEPRLELVDVEHQSSVRSSSVCSGECSTDQRIPRRASSCTCRRCRAAPHARGRATASCPP